MLSAKDQDALLRHMGTQKWMAQVARQIWQQPTVTKQFVPPPKPPVDYDAEIERMENSLAKWRNVLVELAQGHVADGRTGRCKRCHAEAPCQTRRTLNRLDNELVERVAVADSGDPADGFAAADQPAPEVHPEWTLSQLYEARNRWRRALTELTIDHMIVDDKGHCSRCPGSKPCEVNKAVNRINKGIARQIENYACMDDGQRELALGERPTAYYLRDEEDWDAV